MGNKEVLFVFFLLLVTKGSAATLKPCTSEQMACPNGQCIQMIWRCDGEQDCEDGSDEVNCGAITCDAKTQLRCDDGQCIPISWACDGTNDCQDGTDERNCKTAQKCQSENDFSCTNGLCILSSRKCDGRNDCGDNSDELGCSTLNPCTSEQMACPNGQCIQMIWRCDGEQDCEDGSDEVNCGAITCDAKTQLRCDDGQCIPISWACDGTNDCQDGTDERNCTKSSADCNSEEYFCTFNSRCISRRWICDGNDDCGDGSDEPPDCSKTVLATPTPHDFTTTPPSACYTYTCPVSGECLSWSAVCDGKIDCDSQMDEGMICSCTRNNGGCAQQCQPTPEGPKCSCYEGYALSKDGFACEEANECNKLGHCSHFCNYTKEGSKCSCAEGYDLDTDQRTCKAVGNQGFLTYLLRQGIQGLGPLPKYYYFRKNFISRNFESVTGMDYDATARVFFWADQKEKTINSFPMDSPHLVVSFKTQHEPVYLRRDWMTKNLYYTTDEGSIMCCNTNGSYCTSVITNISPHISGFNISPKFAFVFWAVSRLHDHNVSLPDSGFINRANMDGSFSMVIVSKHIVSPTAITVDPVLKSIYWCDSVLGVIESTDFNGLGRRKIVENLHYPTSLAVFEDFIYWSGRGTHRLTRCNKFNCNHQLIIDREATQIKCLVIVHEAAQIKGENRCADNNCLHLCLPTRTSFVCKCDDRNSSETTNCRRDPTLGNQSCPDDYCSRNAECVVEEDRYVCRCPSHFTGERCEESLGQDSNSSKELNPVWLVCAALIVICAGLLATSMIVYRRYRRKSTAVYSSVQFVSTGSCTSVQTKTNTRQ